MAPSCWRGAGRVAEQQVLSGGEVNDLSAELVIPRMEAAHGCTTHPEEPLLEVFAPVEISVITTSGDRSVHSKLW